METKKCIESATANVVIIVGALIEAGVNPTFIHPPKPIATKMHGKITKITDIVAYMERTRRNVTSKITIYIAGTSVIMSVIDASENALLNIVIPLRLIFTSKSASIFKAKSRAASETSTTSKGSVPGNCTVTFTAVDLCF